MVSNCDLALLCFQFQMQFHEIAEKKNAAKVDLPSSQNLNKMRSVIPGGA